MSTPRKPRKTAVVEPVAVVETAPVAMPTINAVKGFNPDLSCTPNGKRFEYELGQTYTHNGPVVKCTEGGFHAVDYPLAVFNFYPPAGENGQPNRFADVTAAGAIDRDESDSKIACGSIAVNFELSLSDLTRRAISWVMERLDKSAPAASNTGNRSAASNTGNRSAASNTGDYSAASNTGNRSAASNTGYQSAASNTGYQSAASNTGYQSAASNTGDYSAASVSGKASVAVATGVGSRARASAGSAIVLVNRNDDGSIRHIRAQIAGTEGVMPDTWYTLDAAGKFVEVA